MDKYEYLTGEDLGVKPSTVEQAKFEYYLLVKIFNKGLSEEDKKEGILKRLENIKDKKDELLSTFSTTNKSSRNKINNQSKKLIYNAEHSFAKLRNIDDIKKLSLNSMYSLMRKYHKRFTSLKNLVLRTENNKVLKQEVLINAGDIYNKLYYIYQNKYNKKTNRLDKKNRTKLDYKKLRLADIYDHPSDKEQEKIQEETITDANAFNEWIIKKEADINNELFMEHVNFQNPSDMLKNLYQINDREKKNKSVNLINSGLKDLKEERENEKQDKIVEIVEDILRFIKQKQEGQAGQEGQEGQGIKILTPNQMLSRLPISLAQLKAENNSEKLKNEIRQLLYSLYRSKDMTKQVYNNLIKPI